MGLNKKFRCLEGWVNTSYTTMCAGLNSDSARPNLVLQALKHIIDLMKPFGEAIMPWLLASPQGITISILGTTG